MADPFKLTTNVRSHIWTLAMLQQLRCMWWLGVSVTEIQHTLGVRTEVAVRCKARAMGLFRPDWFHKAIHTAYWNRGTKKRAYPLRSV
jgi:hypothetical protein